MFPRTETLAIIASKLGVSEASLVQLPSTTPLPYEQGPQLRVIDSRLAIIGELVQVLAQLDDANLKGLLRYVRALKPVEQNKNVLSEPG